MHCKRTGESEYDLTKTKNIITYEALALALKKKNLTLFIIFPDILSTFQTFSRSRKVLGKFQDFFKNSRLCTNPKSLGQLFRVRT